MIKKVLKKIITIPNTIYNHITLRRNHVALGDRSRIIGRIFIKSNGSISIGKEVIIRSSPTSNPIGAGDRTYIQVLPGADLSIGDYVGISNSAITCASSVVIEDYAMLGAGCKIYDTDFHPLLPDDRMRGSGIKAASEPIVIGAHCFIGAGTMILKGVQIGENSVIGAGAVVTKNVPPNQVWAGNPARYIRDLNT